MKVGIFLGNVKTEEGGGFTMQQSILQSLFVYKTSHEYFIFYYANDYIRLENINPKIKSIRIFDLAIGQRAIRVIKNYFRKNKDRYGGLHHASIKYKIDILWFTTYSFEYTGLPYIYTVWDLQHRLQPFFPELNVNDFWYNRDVTTDKILKKATFVLTGTQRGKEEISLCYNVHHDNIKLLPHPTPLFVLDASKHTIADVQNKYQINTKIPYLFYPAQFWPHKNHIRALKALKILKENYNILLQLIFVGADQGNKDYIIENTEKLGLVKDVKILGFVPQEDLIIFYQNAFLLIYATLFGPENLPPLEAMALGCPVVSSDVPGAMEQYGDNVLYFKRLQEKDLAEKILILYSDKNLRETLIAKGRKRAMDYTSKHYVMDMEKLIDEFAKYRECWE